ncbi:MAG: hypothetical protein KDD62_11555, partial [Bdellovibrionales bacterium]|nr:hypothetical protein [Bdellovibrionales bacterium]
MQRSYIFSLFLIALFQGSLLADPLYSTKASKTGLVWFTQDELGASSTLHVEHGEKNDLPVVANWTGQEPSALVVHAKSKAKKAQLDWQLNDSGSELSS